MVALRPGERGRATIASSTRPRFRPGRKSGPPPPGHPPVPATTLARAYGITPKNLWLEKHPTCENFLGKNSWKPTAIAGELGSQDSRIP